MADALAKALQQLTLGQISVWHSSDSSGQGGLKPGHVWLDEIRNQLARSKAVVALLTPRSIARPWLLFESGFGAANKDCDVIPVCVGIDNLNSVPFPLAMYQSYQLADYDSLKGFVEKLFARYEVQFDEEMSREVLAKLIRKLVGDSTSDLADASPAPTPSLESVLDDLKMHIDKRVLEIATLRPGPEDARSRSGFNVSLNLRAFSTRAVDQYLEISSDMSVQDVLDAVFYMIPDMPSFQYLHRWLLRDSAAGLNLIIREIGSRVPAHAVFQPGSHWDVVRLSKPYSPEDSQDTDRWYGQP